jgi:UDP-glucose 4-epimerase
MKIIIFGGNGFLGYAFKSYFGSDNALSVSEITMLTLDLLRPVDVFINCAGASNVLKSFQHPSNDFEKNSILVHRLLELIRISGNEKLKFLNLSSAAVYGNPKVLPIRESSECIPISPYGSHKLISEEICRYYSKCFGIKTVSLRIFSAYGNGQKKMLFWDLHQKILNSNGEITLFGTGNESRDFIHIEDIYWQLILAIENSNFDGEAVNVANGKGVYIKDIVQIYKKHYPKSFTYQFNGENRPGDPLNWCADISRMSYWGYLQKVKIEEGIVKYISSL